MWNVGDTIWWHSSDHRGSVWSGRCVRPAGYKILAVRSDGTYDIDSELGPLNTGLTGLVPSNFEHEPRRKAIKRNLPEWW